MMKKRKITGIAVVLLCILQIFSVACSSDKKPASPSQNPSLNSVELGGLDIEFKYSKDYSTWESVTGESELFRADGAYSAGDTELVYLHIKNHTTSSVAYSVSLRSISKDGICAMFGFSDGIRTAFSDSAAAVSAIGDLKEVGSGYIKTEVLSPESTLTFAVAVSVPTNGQGGEMKLRLDFKAEALTEATESGSVLENGKYSVFADDFNIVETADTDTVVSNSDGSFEADFKKGSVGQGSVVKATVTPQAADGNACSYRLGFTENGTQFTGSVSVSLLIGYGLENVEIYSGEQRLVSEYDMYSGKARFDTCGGDITVKYTQKTDISGVAVKGSDKMFDSFNSALDFAVKNASGDSLNMIIFGRANYTVKNGDKLRFTKEGSTVSQISVVGGNASAEIFITRDSDQAPSLPYADKGAEISYIGISFQSENEVMADIDYSHNIDYRANADIYFGNCVFYKALATRGASSNVTVDRCIFKCTTYDDTLKGYCFYQIPKAGSSDIKVRFTNNTVTDSWGGINLDWSQADFYVSGNMFAGFECSKAAIQLSNAKTAVIKNNSFKDIVNENALRFYKLYGAESTVITDNYFDCDHLLQSDVFGALNGYSQFTFENNTITERTSLTDGHTPNGTADQINQHGYTVDTDKNTIE